MRGDSMEDHGEDQREAAVKQQHDEGRPLLRLACYGTLRRGHANHERFCSGYLDVQPVEIPGILRWLSPTIPILEVPERLILAVGTADPLADVATQARWMARFEAEGHQYQDRGEEPTHRNLDAVAGEVFTFGDADDRLPAIDRLEGFRPGGSSLYRRILVGVWAGDVAPVPAWIYAAPVYFPGRQLE